MPKREPQERGRAGDAARSAKELGHRIAGLRRARRFVEYRESFDFATDLQEILDAIVDLTRADPKQAFRLLDRFILTDKRTFDRVDDSSGAIGDVYREAATSWLDAAAEHRRLDASAERWIDLVQERSSDDDYGVRENLLNRAQRLLSEEELRRLASHYEEEAGPVPVETGTAFETDWIRHRALTHLSLVAEALEDPGLYERSVALHSGALNDLQAEKVARRYLDAGRPDEAIACLEGRARGQLLLAKCYAAAGRSEEQASLLWAELERSLSPKIFDDLVDLHAARAKEVRQRATALALDGHPSSAAIELLLHLEEPELAQRRAISAPGVFTNVYWADLTRILRLAEDRDVPLLRVLLLRALLFDILESGRTTAYGHAARYLARLERLDAVIDSYQGLPSHDSLLAELRKRHGRKSSFWRRVG